MMECLKAFVNFGFLNQFCLPAWHKLPLLEARRLAFCTSYQSLAVGCSRLPSVPVHSRVTSLTGRSGSCELRAFLQIRGCCELLAGTAVGALPEAGRLGEAAGPQSICPWDCCLTTQYLSLSVKWKNNTCPVRVVYG